jgi:hypothetical protein
MLYNPKDVFESLNLCNKIFSKIKSIENDFLDFDQKLAPGNEYTDTKQINSIGKYFHYNGKENAVFIGLNLNLIRYNIVDIHKNKKKAEDYVYSIVFYKEYLSEHDNLDFFEDDKWIYIPLNKKYLLEENKTELMDQIKSILSKCVFK